MSEPKRSEMPLSDDWHQGSNDGPLAYLVGDGEGMYQVFANILEARRYADSKEDDDGEVRLIYPLYASHGVDQSEIPRTWW